MDLKDKLLSSFLAFENNVDLNSPVHDVRSEAIKNFETKGFPSKKEEAWKYTSLNNLQKIDLKSSSSTIQLISLFYFFSLIMEIQSINLRYIDN